MEVLRQTKRLEQVVGTHEMVKTHQLHRDRLFVTDSIDGTGQMIRTHQ
jgi:hypothetical protein